MNFHSHVEIPKSQIKTFCQHFSIAQTFGKTSTYTTNTSERKTKFIKFFRRNIYTYTHTLLLLSTVLLWHTSNLVVIIKPKPKLKPRKKKEEKQNINKTTTTTKIRRKYRGIQWRMAAVSLFYINIYTTYVCVPALSVYLLISVQVLESTLAPRLVI